jgi:hypothetical protein
MPHSITCNPETHIIEIKLHGQINFNEIKEIYSQALPISKDKNSSLFLSDYREAVLCLSTIEIYELPQIFADTAAAIGFSPYQLKRAIVQSKTHNPNDYRFFETVSQNRRQSFAKLFQDIEEAKKWLSEK